MTARFGTYLLLVLLVLGASFANSQNMARARFNLDSLTAPGMYGRGASNNGDKIAAAFLQQYFKRFGLKPILSDSGFFQSFHYDINTFEKSVCFASGKKVFKTGLDYILHPSSGSAKGTFKTLLLDSISLNNEAYLTKLSQSDIKKNAFVIDSKYLKGKLANSKLIQQILLRSGCVIELQGNKLLAGLSQDQYPMPWIIANTEIVQSLKSKVKIDITATLKRNYESNNIVGYVPAKVPTDSFIVITAHYDHLGNLGAKQYFPGANDNASGICMMLELMSFFSKKPNNIHSNLVFIAFGAEEAGLIGSSYFVEHSPLELSKVKFLVNLDLLGTGEDGIMVVNGSVHEKEFKIIESINSNHQYLKEIKKRGKAANSDHYWFSQKGVPAFFIYTLGGIAYYHDVYDKSETLPLTKFGDVYRLLIDYINAIQ